MPNLDPADFPELESISVTVVEVAPDGRRYVTVYRSLEDIPESLRASIGSEDGREANALDLAAMVREAYQQGPERAEQA